MNSEKWLVKNFICIVKHAKRYPDFVGDLARHPRDVCTGSKLANLEKAPII